jgi:hypothetical protein
MDASEVPGTTSVKWDPGRTDATAALGTIASSEGQEPISSAGDRGSTAATAGPESGVLTAARGGPVAERILRSRGLAPTAVVGLIFLASIAVGVFGDAAPASAGQYRRCAPVVGRAPGGFDRATVLVVAGKVDCEKSRHAIWNALSGKRYADRDIQGWTCSSTARVSSGHLFGATCVREDGEREAVRSTTPRPCPSCSSIRE